MTTLRENQRTERQLDVIGYPEWKNEQRKQTPGKKEHIREQGKRTKERRIREQRQRAKRKRKMVFFLWKVIFAAVIVLFIWNIRLRLRESGDIAVQDSGWKESAAVILNIGNEKSGSGIEAGGYAETIGEVEVGTPVKRNEAEVRSRLEELAAENEVIRQILNNIDAYPDNMLEALANNPEMADFAAGYPTAEKQVQGGLNEEEKNQRHPLFLQWDSRWGYVSYGDDSNIGLAGCGPTCLSMALFILTRDETLTPDKIASYGMENGYYMSGTGTLWALMEDVPLHYGVSVNKPGISDSIMKSELDSGHVLICAMRAGDFTAAGHFILIYGYDETGFFVNDPNCVARSKKTWSYDRIGGQIKQLWSLSG